MIPTLQEFLKAPADEVAAVCPETVVFAAANTRRAAALNGITPDMYLEWITQRLSQVIPLFFQLGVKHLIVPTLGGTQLDEPMSGYGYGKRVIDWIDYFSSDARSSMVIAAYKYGFRIRIFGTATKSIPKIAEIASKLSTQVRETKPTLWLYTVGHKNEPWNEILTAARTHANATREDIVRILYGENVSPAKMFIGSGRWVINPEILPPLLCDDDMHCYWINGAGIDINEEMIRGSIYDTVFSRNTDGELQKDRYSNIEVLRENWNNSQIIGTGRQIGGFWIVNHHRKD